MLDLALPVVLNSRNGVVVPFNHEIVCKAGARQAQCQPTTSTKNLNATHIFYLILKGIKLENDSLSICSTKLSYGATDQPCNVNSLRKEGQ